MLPFSTPQNNAYNGMDWNPFNEFSRTESEMSRLFNSAYSRFHQNLPNNRLSKMPTLDLEDTGKAYVVTMDMPGADPTSLNTELKDGQLSVTMNTEQTDTDDNQGYQYRERFSGTFKRVLTLPGPVNVSAMTTNYKDGVLTIVVPKA